LTEVRARVARVHVSYQRADYAATARLVPDALAAAEASAGQAQQPRRQAQAALAVAHLAASKLAVKLGDASLAWVAADRSARSAAVAGDTSLVAAAGYSIACALLAMPERQDDAAEVAASALASTHAGHAQPTRVGLSVRGALTLLSAVIAARHAQSAIAEAHLDAAADLADQLGADRNDLWTGFGPTNVLIHRVGIAAIDRPDHAIRIGERLDPSGMPPALVSRRGQIHLDLATAFARRPHGDASAVLHLLEAERLAPQVFRVRAPVRQLVSDLLRREHRTVTPGLRALATRVGLAA
jgi:hypothetical protein